MFHAETCQSTSQQMEGSKELLLTNVEPDGISSTRKIHTARERNLLLKYLGRKMTRPSFG